MHHSTNEHLHLTISQLRDKVNSQDVLVSITTEVVTKVAQELLSNHALLLSNIYEEFTRSARSHGLKAVPSKRWLLAEMANTLYPHVDLQCRIPRVGTVVCRRGGDMMYALSHALNELKHTSTIGKAKVVNSQIHKQAAEFSSHYSNPLQLADTTMDSILSRVNPELWMFVATLTQGKNKLDSVNKARTLYCLCVLLFVANPQCCYPLHLSLTDLVLRQGGTKELVTILNRFGATACNNTHYRFLKKLDEQRPMMLTRELHCDAFRVVTVENIDLLQSHAQVYADNPSRSYHGTSIQCIEPGLTPVGSDSITPTHSPSVLHKPKRVCALHTPISMGRTLPFTAETSLPMTSPPYPSQPRGGWH